jgi:hypothetical protein
VARHHHFDVLLSDHGGGMALPSWSNYHHLLDFAAARYDNILVDLPEVGERCDSRNGAGAPSMYSSSVSPGAGIAGARALPYRGN